MLQMCCKCTTFAQKATKVVQMLYKSGTFAARNAEVPLQRPFVPLSFLWYHILPAGALRGTRHLRGRNNLMVLLSVLLHLLLMHPLHDFVVPNVELANPNWYV